MLLLGLSETVLVNLSESTHKFEKMALLSVVELDITVLASKSHKAEVPPPTDEDKGIQKSR